MAPDGAPAQLVYDCDPGIDDALALAVLADAVRRGRIALHAVVAVGGNVGLDHTAANVAFLCHRLGLDVPTFAGSATPLAGAIPGDAAEVHGADGLGGLRGAGGWAMPRPATPGDLVQLVADLDPDLGPRVVLATGPLTDLARMVELEPDLRRHVDRVVVMGGAFGHPGGNVTPHAEFNVWVDPEAWQVVAGAGLPLEVVPLDATTRVVLRREDVAALEDAAGGPTLTSRIVAAGIDLYEDLLGTPFCEMHDPLAAAAVIDPDLLTWTAAAVSVRLEEAERGRTVRAPAPASGSMPVAVAPARIALDVDVERAHAALVAALGRVADR